MSQQTWKLSEMDAALTLQSPQTTFTPMWTRAMGHAQQNCAVVVSQRQVLTRPVLLGSGHAAGNCLRVLAHSDPVTVLNLRGAGPHEALMLAL